MPISQGLDPAVDSMTSVNTPLQELSHMATCDHKEGWEMSSVVLRKKESIPYPALSENTPDSHLSHCSHLKPANSLQEEIVFCTSRNQTAIKTEHEAWNEKGVEEMFAKWISAWK